MAYKLGGGHIQGQSLQVNVVGARHLADKEWFSRQDPYVTIEYGNNRYRTRTDTDGGKNPSFNEKFTVPLIEGLREMNVSVFNSNTVAVDDFIGSARVLLEKVLSTGYDDTSWSLKSKHGKTAGEVNLILHYAANAASAKAGKEDKMYGTGYPPAAYPSAHGAPGGYPSSGYAPSAPAGYPPPAHGAPTGYPPPAHGAPTGYPPPAHGAPAGYPPAHGAPSGYPPAGPSGYGAPSYAAAPAPGYPPAGGYPPPGYPPPQSSHGAQYPPAHGQAGAQYPPPAGYSGAPPSVYGVPPGMSHSGKLHVGSSGHYKHGKHKKHKGHKWGKKYKGRKGWKHKK